MSGNVSTQNEKPENTYDVIIIGGGPAGLSAAIYAARSRLDTLVIDKNPSAGALGSAHKIANYPGIPTAIPGIELLSIFRSQAESFGARIIKAQVAGVNFEADQKEIYTNDEVFTGKTVIIASGSIGRTPSLAGEEKFRGRGVSYCATCDAAFYKDHVVVMAGELDEIGEEIDAIARFVKKIYIITRNKNLTKAEADVFERHPGVELKLGHHIKEIQGNDKVSGVVISDSTGNSMTIQATGVFIYLRGNQPVVDYLYGAVQLNDGCILLSDKDMSTSVKGVFAAGDVTCKKIRQVVVASSEGCIAALSAEQYINKRERARSQWSQSEKSS
jgi:thioredoxin reductase (NADPH)